MSGLYIHGMKKPASCDSCLIPMTWCMNHQNKDYPHCPLVEVQNHGRLIDADAFQSMMEKNEERHNKEHLFGISNEDIFDAIEYELCHCPTVIPAEGGAE